MKILWQKSGRISWLCSQVVVSKYGLLMSSTQHGHGTHTTPKNPLSLWLLLLVWHKSNKVGLCFWESKRGARAHRLADLYQCQVLRREFTKKNQKQVNLNKNIMIICEGLILFLVKCRTRCYFNGISKGGTHIWREFWGKISSS